MSQLRSLIARARRSLWSSALGLIALAPPVAAQGDSVPAGPPPHFVAAWAPPGTFIDVSRMGTLRNRVSLDLTDVPINTAILMIIQKAELGLVYFGDIVPEGRRVSIHATGITAASALAEILLDTGIDVVMTRDGRLGLAKCTHVQAIVAKGDSGVVTGRIIDRNTNAPLAGATLTVEGVQLSAVASTDGRYRLVGLPAGKHVVVARYIGYAPSNDTVVVGPDGSIQDFRLTPSAQLLEQVVVTGTLVPTEVKAIPTPITIITADDIRRQNVMRMGQLFRGQVASMFAWDQTALDYYNTIIVRGASSLSTQSIKTFVDGIEIADPQFNALIDPNSIERIELTRGPQASTMYGSDAIDGVLQIFTKKGTFGLKRPEGEIKTSASVIEKNDTTGAAARLEEAVTVRGSGQHTRYQVAAYYRHDGEWTPDYQNTNWNVTASAENVQGPLTSRISALFARKMFDFPQYTAWRKLGYPFSSRPLFERIDVQTQTYGVNFVYTATPWWRHDLVLGYDRLAFGMIQTEPRFTTPADTLLQVIMNQRGKMSIFYYTTVNAKLSRAVRATLTAGFNHYYFDGSNVYSPATTKNAGTLDGPTTLLRLTSTNSGYFAQAQVNIAETIFLTMGARAERSSSFGESVGTVVSPRLGASYVRPIGPVTIKLRASYGESIRAPYPAQNQTISSTGFDQLYNPALRPERQHGGDGGVDLYWGPRASLSASYYKQEAIDLIGPVYGAIVGEPPHQQTQQQNVGRIKNCGWEIEGRYGLERLQVSGAFSVTYSRIQKLDAAYSGNFLVDDRPFDVPHHTIGLTVAYDLSRGTTLRGSVTSVGDWVERDWIAFGGALFGGVPPRPSDRDYWITYPGFTKVRIGFERKLWKSVSGAFDIENLMQEHAFELHNVIPPTPRTFTLALRASY